MPEWIEDPVLKLRMHMQVEGNRLGGDVELLPGGAIGGHLHPAQEERWTVLEGKVRLRVGRQKHVPQAGEELVVAPGVVHSLKNVGSSTAQLRFAAEPPLGLEPFLTEIAALDRSGQMTSFGAPKTFGALLTAIALLDRYKDTVVLSFPPPPVQPLVLAPLARLAARRQGRGRP